ncbi:hypothetical protein [Lysobacter gummosus]
MAPSGLPCCSFASAMRLSPSVYRPRCRRFRWVPVIFCRLRRWPLCCW